MEAPETPLISNINNINNNNNTKEGENILGFVFKDDSHIYQIEIKTNNNFITIICKNTCIEEEIYSCRLNKQNINRSK